MKDNRISVRLTFELLAKVERWKSCGYHASDIVRHALALLPGEPAQPPSSSAKIIIKPLSSQNIEFELKDETVALKAMQEW